MNKKFCTAALAAYIAFGVAIFPALGIAAGTVQTILTTTFPIYQLVRHVTLGLTGITVELMLPSQLGCPHDYALTPQDMQRLAKADILVINGLGMEEFLGAPLQKANSHLRVIDSSMGITETIQHSATEHDTTEEQDAHHDHTVHNTATHSEYAHHDTDTNLNPHLFASPRMMVKLVMNIAIELSKIDPPRAAAYSKNAQAYATIMNRLADDMASLGKRLKNNRIVQPHGVFDYLARDMGLDIVAVMQAHGQAPSVADTIQLVKIIKAKSVGAIVTEPQYSAKIGLTLSKATGVPIITLDPVAHGPEDAPLTYYEDIMHHNMQVLEVTLGVQ